jgi:hypothetical protein
MRSESRVPSRESIWGTGEALRVVLRDSDVS